MSFAVLTVAQVLRWKVITIFEAIIELALVVLPAYLVSRVHMKLDQKVLVVVAFAFKLPYEDPFLQLLTHTLVCTC